MTNLSKVGKYEVQELVGEGAMGVVYRALDPMLNRSVAVKVMNEALALDEDFRSRFLREARAAGSLQHPNVITVYDCGETEGHLYIAMEYVEGTDLEQLIESKVPLSLTDRLDIVIGVLNGLTHAHKHGIVHRDMKPANVRVNDEGRALIMDFGIAHTTSSNVTKTGLILGTPNYMAPEQVTGGGVTAQSDIFSVGVVLYELLTNVKPFEGGTLHNVLFKIVGEDPPPPHEVVAGLRPELSDIVTRALAKNPADRWGSALEMANALTQVKASISADGPTPGPRTISLRSSIDMVMHTHEHEQRALIEQKVREEFAAANAEAAAAERRRRTVYIGIAAVLVAVAGSTMMISPGDDAPIDQAAQVQQSGTTPAPQSAPTTPPVASAPPPTTPRVEPVVTPPRTPPRTTPASPAASATLPRPNRTNVDSESASRTAAANAVREQPITPVVATAPPPAAPAVTQPIQQPVSQPAAQPVSNPSAEIAAVVAQYARAIESRNVAELRRIYPAMSAAQAGAFEDFFRSVRNLRATFSVSSLQVDGASADARLSGTYDFETSNGRAAHQPLALQAVLRRDNGVWRFVSIK